MNRGWGGVSLAFPEIYEFIDSVVLRGIWENKTLD